MAHFILKLFDSNPVEGDTTFLRNVITHQSYRLVSETSKHNTSHNTVNCSVWCKPS